MKKISFQNKIYTEKKLKYNVNTICSSEDGRKFTIEMQMENMGYYIERAVFYSSNVYIASYDNKKLLKDKKSKYSSLHPVYSINILNYKQFSDKEAIHIFNLYDSKHNMYLENVYGQNVLSIGFLELKKNDKTLSENMIYWIEFFKTEKTPEGAPEYIKKAAKLIFVNNFSKEERQMLNRIELMKEDAKAREFFVREETLKQGRAEGKAEGKAEAIEQVAKNLIKLKMTIEEISKATGLTKAQIEKLKDSK